MTGYLVIARCLQADVPIEMCSSREQALTVARLLRRNTISCVLLLVNAQARLVYGCGVSEVICLVLVPFVNGIPGPMEVIELVNKD